MAYYCLYKKNIIKLVSSVSSLTGDEMRERDRERKRKEWGGACWGRIPTEKPNLYQTLDR